MEVKLDPKHTKSAAGDEADSRESIAAWDWPLMDKPDVTPESNVLGYASNWYQAEQEPQQAEDQGELEPEQQPLTLEEIEAVRQAAYDDGFVEGREAGFAQGLEEGRQQGLQEGHQQGFDQGQIEGLTLGKSQIDEQAAHWKLLAEQLTKPLAQMDEQVEQQLVYLALRLAKSLIRHEAKTSPDLLLTSLKEAVALLPCAEEGITLSLHPEDLQLIRDVYSEEECQRRGWTLQAEPALQRGDLQLASRTSSIDWMLEERIDNLLRNFLRSNLGSKP